MPVRVGVARPAEWVAAARALFAAAADPIGAAERFVALLRAAEIDPAGLFAATDESGAVRAACLAVPHPGAQGQLLSPTPTDPDGDDRLVEAALAWLATRGTKIVQANLRDDDAARAGPLLRTGFRHVTRIGHYEADATGHLPNTDPRFRLVPIRQTDPATFTRVLLETYSGTLDCPELDGVRSADEVVAGYRGLSGLDPVGFLAISSGRPAGILILHRDSPSVFELEYLGIVPEFRRTGLGRHLTRVALGEAFTRGAARVTLGVDERNTPAIRLYEREGFRLLGRSEVYLKFVPPTSIPENGKTLCTGHST